MQIQGHRTGLTEFSHISISLYLLYLDSLFYHISLSIENQNKKGKILLSFFVYVTHTSELRLPINLLYDDV